MKEQTNIMIDYDLKQKAKDSNIEMGAFFNDALRRHFEPRKKDLPEEKLLIRCDNCHAIVDFCFYCEETKRVFCEDCEKAIVKNEIGMINKFPCSNKEDHSHVRVPNLLGGNIEMLKKIAQNQSGGNI